MHEAGVLPGLMTYNTLIAGCVRAEHPNEALSVFKLMKERNIKRDQVNVTGVQYCGNYCSNAVTIAILR